jgi:HlyD family secretion protein
MIVKANMTAAILILAISIPLYGCNRSAVLELSGTIESTQIDCNAEVAGKVVKLEKEEGTSVTEGDVIAVLDSSLQELAVKQQEALVKLKLARLDELKAGTRPEQVQQAEAAVKSADIAVKNAQTGVDSASTSYDYWLAKYENVKSLSESGSATENDLLDAKYKLDTSIQQLEVAQKQLKSAQTQLQSTQSQLTLLKKGSTSQAVQAAEADLEQSQAALEHAELILSRYHVKAPASGTLLIKNVEIGDMVNSGTNMGTLSDLSDLWINVYIQQKNLKRISLGQELDLRIQALEGQHIKGKITFISHQAEFTPKNVETDDAKENTVFKVKIKILDNIDGLKPGMTANAIIPVVLQ